MSDADPPDADDPFGSSVPSRIVVEAGGTVRRPLVSAAGSGYRWELEPIDAGAGGSAFLDVDVGPLEPMAEAPSNAPAPLTLAAVGLRPGASHWRVRLVRPWLPDEPLVDRVIEVVVIAGGADEEPDVPTTGPTVPQ